MKENSKIFKALGDDNRLYILHLLQTGEVCACKLLDKMQVGQSTLSHHMKILCDSGLVISRKDGKWVHYSLNKKLFSRLAAQMAVYAKEK